MELQDKLEVHYLRWVLGVKVGKSNILAARALAAIPSIGVRAAGQRITMIGEI